MHIAANLDAMFIDLPFTERVLAARLAGFDGVEWRHDESVATILLAEALARAALPLARVVIDVGPFALESALERALTDAAMLRPLQVSVSISGLLSADERLDALLRRASEAFRRLGIGVVCHEVDAPPGDAASLQRLTRLTEHAGCRMLLDLSVASDLAGIAPLIGRLGYVVLSRPPGEDFATVLESLRSWGYAGWLGLSHDSAERAPGLACGSGSHRPA